MDGQERTIHTFDGKVADVLKAQGIATDGHDQVAPAPGDSLVDGEQISVRYGRQLDVNVDGKNQQIWSTATTVDEALGDLGLHGSNPYLSVNRDQAIGRQGLSFDIRTQRHVNILVDGRSIPLDTTAQTVAQALAQANVKLAGQDTAPPDPATFPTQGENITVERDQRDAGDQAGRDRLLHHRAVGPELVRRVADHGDPGRAGRAAGGVRVPDRQRREAGAEDRQQDGHQAAGERGGEGRHASRSRTPWPEPTT